jgi:hypothetical protein
MTWLCRARFEGLERQASVYPLGEQVCVDLHHDAGVGMAELAG